MSDLVRPTTRRARSGVVLLAAIAAAAILAGCGSTETSGDGRPKVLTTFTVIADMARQVGGDRIDVRSITKIGAEIHGYEPTPGDLRNAAGADLVLENGFGLERWFEQFIDRAGTKHVTLSEGVDPIPIAAGSAYTGKPNPHAWMSVENAQVYVDNIRDAFAELDPAGEGEFTANAERYKAELRKVGDFVKRELAEIPASHRALVTCEGAFSYLARDFDLDEQFLWPVNAEQQGTPQQVADSVNFVREREVPAVFCESTVSDKSQRQVARESGAKFAGTLYVDSLSKPGGPVPSYVELLRRDAETIVGGLGGGS